MPTKEVEIVHEFWRDAAEQRPRGMLTISYGEKTGIQALAVPTFDRQPVVGQHGQSVADYEYERLGTVALLPGLDLHSGRVFESRQGRAQQC